MSAYGEYFIHEDLSEAARSLGLLKPNEQLVLPDGYYGIYDARNMTNDTVKIEDIDTGEAKGELTFTGEVNYDEDTGNYYDIKTIERDGVNLDAVTGHKVGDWLIHLQPILDDFKDGESTITSEDVDWLMTTLRAKVEYVEGLISEEEYTTILNDIER